MTTKQISEIVELNNPGVERNNRICRRTSHGFLRAGFPYPKGRETDQDLKGGDYIGWTTKIITPDMVGQKVAVFTNIEVKGAGDRLVQGQKDMHDKIINAGGISLVYQDKKGKLEIKGDKFGI